MNVHLLSLQRRNAWPLLAANRSTHHAQRVWRPQNACARQRSRRFAGAGYAAVSMREIASRCRRPAGSALQPFSDQAGHSQRPDAVPHGRSFWLPGKPLWNTPEVPWTRLNDLSAFTSAITWNVRTRSSSPTWNCATWSPENFETIETERRRYEAILTSALEEGLGCRALHRRRCQSLDPRHHRHADRHPDLVPGRRRSQRTRDRGSLLENGAQGSSART